VRSRPRTRTPAQARPSGGEPRRPAAGLQLGREIDARSVSAGSVRTPTPVRTATASVQSNDRRVEVDVGDARTLAGITRESSRDGPGGHAKAGDAAEDPNTRLSQGAAGTRRTREARAPRARQRRAGRRRRGARSRLAMCRAGYEQDERHGGDRARAWAARAHDAVTQRVTRTPRPYSRRGNRGRCARRSSAAPPEPATSWRPCAGVRRPGNSACRARPGGRPPQPRAAWYDLRREHPDIRAPGHVTPGGITPSSVYTSPFRRTRRPTTPGRPRKCLCHSLWPRPRPARPRAGRSARLNVRPTRASTPRTVEEVDRDLAPAEPHPGGRRPRQGVRGAARPRRAPRTIARRPGSRGSHPGSANHAGHRASWTTPGRCDRRRGKAGTQGGIPYTALKIALLAPIPSASVRDGDEREPRPA